MAITVSMWSDKKGEIKRFLNSFYQKEVKMDDDIGQWIYVYTKPLEAIDIISAVMDNKDKFHISMCLQVDKADPHVITEQNHNDIVKSILYLYYQEPCTL